MFTETTQTFASLDQATAWINSDRLDARDLDGNVVLVNFWTLSCINWIRTLPYLRAWDAKYRDQGLVTLGVHSPEFPFEKNLDNVREAVAAMEITYPIAVDGDFAIWRGFSNSYWPCSYFIDSYGERRHTHVGEGNYDDSERIIHRLLSERRNVGIFERQAVVPDPLSVEAAADWRHLRSGETYVGYARAKNFSSPTQIFDRPHFYSAAEKLKLDDWALAGNWTIGQQAALLNQPGGRLTYRFHARDLHIVMGPSTPGASVAFRVLIDGQEPGDDHGSDVDANGYGVATGERLHHLVRQRERIADRTFDITFASSDIRIYSVTFG